MFHNGPRPRSTSSTISMPSIHSISPIHRKPSCEHIITSLCSISRWKLEAYLLWEKKILFAFCIAVQFMHAIATNIAYYRHIPGARLKDSGYDLIPSVPPELEILSEIVFFSIFAATVFLAIIPFFHQRPLVYMSTMLIRTLFVMALCIICRCITFLSTSLPGPARHCQPYSQAYHPPENIYDILFTIEPFNRCGDLIFSSHSSLSLTLAFTVFVYGKLLIPKILFKCLFYFVMVPLEIVLFILIIAARKHYTVDVVVAAYTTPLLYYASYYFMKDRDTDDIVENEQNMDDYSVFPTVNVL